MDYHFSDLMDVDALMKLLVMKWIRFQHKYKNKEERVWDWERIKFTLRVSQKTCEALRMTNLLAY